MDNLSRQAHFVASKYARHYFSLWRPEDRVRFFSHVPACHVEVEVIHSVFRFKGQSV
jgi:hypothetical protein